MVTDSLLADAEANPDDPELWLELAKSAAADGRIDLVRKAQLMVGRLPSAEVQQEGVAVVVTSLEEDYEACFRHARRYHMLGGSHPDVALMGWKMAHEIEGFDPAEVLRRLDADYDTHFAYQAQVGEALLWLGRASEAVIRLEDSIRRMDDPEWREHIEPLRALAVACDLIDQGLPAPARDIASPAIRTVSRDAARRLALLNSLYLCEAISYAATGDTDRAKRSLARIDGDAFMFEDGHDRFDRLRAALV